MKLEKQPNPSKYGFCLQCIRGRGREYRIECRVCHNLFGIYRLNRRICNKCRLELIKENNKKQWQKNKVKRPKAVFKYQKILDELKKGNKVYTTDYKKMGFKNKLGLKVCIYTLRKKHPIKSTSLFSTTWYEM